MKQLLFGMGLLACATGSYAQTGVRAQVLDFNTGAPLSGANITINNQKFQTDNTGNFSFECTGPVKMTVSFVGYETQLFPVADCKTGITIRLVPSASLLSNVDVTVSNDRKVVVGLPSSATRIGPVQLQRSTGLFLDDALNANVPGVQMQRRGVSSGQTINIRGYGNGTRGTNGASSNFDIQGVKVYLNGIPLTDAENITVLDDIDFASIGDVEVVKGPAGSLYGLAIAGAVNLRTARPDFRGNTAVGQQVLLGSNGLERYTTSFQHYGQRSAIQLSYGHQESKGFMPHNASRKDFINFSGDFRPNDKQVISVYTGFSNSYDQRAGELTIGQYDTLNFSGNPAYIKNDAHSHVLSVRMGVTHTYRFNQVLTNTTTVYGSGIMNDASSAGGWTDKTPVNFGLRSTFATRFRLGQQTQLTGVTGIESLNQRAQTLGYGMVADSANLSGYNRIGALRSNVATKTGNNSLFSEWTLALPRDWSVTAGIGWSQQLIELNDRFFVAANNRPNARAADMFRKNYNGLWAPHLAVSKTLLKTLSVFANYSTGYKAPVSSYFYIPYVAGAPGTGQVNPDLKPEKGEQLEAGIKGTAGRLQFELTGFQTVFHDKMTTNAVPGPNSATSYTYVTNGGRQVHKGLEAGLRYPLLKQNISILQQVTPFANSTWIEGRYRDYQFERFAVPATPSATPKDSVVDWTGNRVAGLPPLVYTVGIDFLTRPGVYANVYYTHRVEVYLTSDNFSTQKANAFGLLNAKLGFRRALGRHFDLDAWVAGSNLTGEKHYLMVFINQLPDAYIPGPLDAQWTGSLSLKYNF